jgi:hypothetical protein
MRQVMAALVFGSISLASIPQPISAAELLISVAEAKLPPAPDAGVDLRGISRGPGLEQVSPDPDARNVMSPLPLKIRFIIRNNAAIELSSVKLTYLKTPAIDLTDRIKPYLSGTGIDMEQAEAPPGIHIMRLVVKDAQGRANSAMIKLTVGSDSR